ncbi:MAG: LysM peptidoglycan-binding domain-containing protein, partial [Lentisphaerae bacterium]|nr:LysM peptidoglycan-binding domain-containing protein [Lentisphaerota bacterium]
IPPPVRSGKTYTVKKGDSLRGIAAKVLGDERHWESLLKQNQSKLSNPDQLRPGMILELPFL